MYPFLLLNTEKSGTINMQILRIFKNTVSMFDCHKAFKNKNTNEMTRILTDALMNIVKNLIPQNTKRFDCKYLKWINSFIISSLKKRTKYTKRLYKNPTDYNKDLLINQANQCTMLTIQAKEKHIAKMSAKLDNPNTARKTYWSIISRFLNRRKMPPILADGKLVSDFKIKAELFNPHFAAQFALVKNASALPEFKYRTDKRLNSFTFNENDIFLIIKNLNADKAHGWYNISIRMIQFCGKEIILPLLLLFKSML